MPKKYEFTKTFTFEGRRYAARGDSEAECLEKMINKKRDLEEGRVVIDSSMTLAAWTEKCLATYKAGVKPETLKTMKYRIDKHLLGQLGRQQLKNIRPIQLQEVLNAQSGMSESHVKKLTQEIKFIFEMAKKNKLILENPAEGLAKPSATRGERRSITEHERKHLLSVAKQQPKHRLWLLMLYCGCRPKEAIRAQGMDIIEIGGYKMLHIRGTKTKNSDRIVPLPDEVYETFKDADPFAPLCPNASGRMHSESSYKRLSKNLKRELNISMGCRVYRNELVPPLPLASDFVPYCLRHTYCTDLQKKGVDIRTAQKLMGHADIQVTANIYTHVDTSQIVEAAKILGSAASENCTKMNAAK